MKKAKIFKISLIVVVILIVLPLIYLAYDRSLMPPKPDWPVPAFTPDPENTPKIDWLQGEGNIYFMNWLESHKKNNALVNYVNAFSSMTMPEKAGEAFYTVLDEGWNKPYPEVANILELNEKALEEVRLGAQMGNCVFPPNPYSFYAPYLNFILTRKLGRLMVVAGRQMEYQKKYNEALQYYFDGMQFGKDIAPKDQRLVTLIISYAIINMQLDPIRELINQDKLTEKDLKQIISECVRIEKEQTTLSDAFEFECRESRTGLSNIGIKEQIKSNDLFGFYFVFYKGHILRNIVKLNDELKNDLATKTYQEFMQIDWEKKTSKDTLTKFLTAPWQKAYTTTIKEICLLHLAQVDSAIRLYHLQKKQWPKSLDELKPNYLTEVPLDPFINQPFKLAEDSTGMFAYSVGPDFKDDKAKIIYGTDTADYQRGDIR